jgi:deoxycytidylate deaminase
VKSDSTDAFRTAFDKNLKVLDYCRALHAEENAIVGLARNAVSAGIATSRMYSTTYPCRLCANKIASLGLQSIIYLEPYPSLDGHEILVNQGVEDQPFEGVTYRAYFRVYGEHR